MLASCCERIKILHSCSLHRDAARSPVQVSPLFDMAISEDVGFVAAFLKAIGQVDHG